MRLRRLSDEEFDEANDLMKSTTVCPTCGTKLKDFGIESSVFATYNLFGNTYPCDCNTQIALYRHYTVANIGENFMRLNWATMYDGSEEVRTAVEEYLDSWEGRRFYGLGLEFGGPLGVGKTFAITHLGKELIKRGQRVYFVGFKEMVNCFTWPNSHKFELKLRSIGFLLLDEVLAPWGNQSQSSLFQDRFEEVIRYRTNNNLPTFLGTNLSNDQLEQHYPRICSLLAAKQTRIDVPGRDFRRQSEFNKMLLELAMNNEKLPIT